MLLMLRMISISRLCEGAAGLIVVMGGRVGGGARRGGGGGVRVAECSEECGGWKGSSRGGGGSQAQRSETHETTRQHMGLDRTRLHYSTREPTLEHFSEIRKGDSMSNATLGQIAFEAYAKKMNWKTYDGKAIPWWKDLSDEVKQGWEAAAAAVAKSVSWMQPKRKNG